MIMLELARWSVSQLPLFALTAMSTHLVVSGSQTLFHYSLGHHRCGGSSSGTTSGSIVRTMPKPISCPPPIAATKEQHPILLLPTFLVAAAMFLVLPTRSFSCRGRCERRLILHTRLF
jgi:hypothetical protein